MAYIKGSTTSTSQAQDVYDELATGLGAHPAWSLETSNVSLEDRDYHVWRCLGTEQQFSDSDYYVVISVGSSTIDFRVAREYDPVENLIRFPVIDVGSSNRYLWKTENEGDGISHTPQRQDDPTRWDPVPPWYGLNDTSDNGFVRVFNIQVLDDSLTEYFITISSDHFVIGTKRHLASSVMARYIGGFEPFNPNHPAPITMWPLPNNSHQTYPPVTLLHEDFYTEHMAPNALGQISSSSYTRSTNYFYPWTNNQNTSDQGEVMGSVRQNPLYPGPLAHRMSFMRRFYYLAGSSTYRTSPEGLALDILYLPAAAVVDIGDEIDINGEPYVYLLDHLWMKRDA